MDELLYYIFFSNLCHLNCQDRVEKFIHTCSYIMCLCSVVCNVHKAVVLPYILIQRKLVAIKVITDSPITTTITDYLNDYKISVASYQTIRKEVSFLSSLHHENLTQLCGVCTNPFMLLIELAPLGSLRSVLNDYQTANAALSSPVLCQSIKQVWSD